jgi:hypothetical protein
MDNMKMKKFASFKMAIIIAFLLLTISAIVVVSISKGRTTKSTQEDTEIRTYVEERAKNLSQIIEKSANDSLRLEESGIYVSCLEDIESDIKLYVVRYKSSY